MFLTGRENLSDETLTTLAGVTRDISTKKTLYIDANGRSFLIGIIRDMTEVVAARREREELVVELQQALAEVRTLREFLPICAYCHRVRDDKNYWSQLETYLHDHAGVILSHGVCPECHEKHVLPMMEELRTQRADEDPGPSALR